MNIRKKDRTSIDLNDRTVEPLMKKISIELLEYGFPRFSRMEYLLYYLSNSPPEKQVAAPSFWPVIT